jgi:hypothetical protein
MIGFLLVLALLALLFARVPVIRLYERRMRRLSHSVDSVRRTPAYRRHVQATLAWHRPCDRREPRYEALRGSAMDPVAAPYLLVGLLAAILVIRDMRSLSNLEAFFNAAGQTLAENPETARIVDDVADMSRNLLSAGLARQMALMALRGALGVELHQPGPRARGFVERWRPINGSGGAAALELPRRFVWELTRTSLVFGSLFGAWLLWRGAQHWRDATLDRWVVLAAVALSVRRSDHR